MIQGTASILRPLAIILVRPVIPAVAAPVRAINSAAAAPTPARRPILKRIEGRPRIYSDVYEQTRLLTPWFAGSV